MDVFAFSSQAKHWVATQEALNSKRDGAYQIARKRVEESWKLEQELSGKSADISLISLEDQIVLISYFETKIRDYCKVFKFDKHIEATAIVLFKRFYLEKSPMEYDPAQILITCLFLSSKIEHQPIPLYDFLKKIPKSPIAEGQMVDLELLVCREVNFELMVHHPYWALHGFFLDIQTYIQQADLKLNKQQMLQALFTIYSEAAELIPTANLTDLPLLYSPSQIALSCLEKVGGKYKDPSVWPTETIPNYVKWKFAGKNWAALFELTAKISKIIDDYKPLDHSSVIAIGKRRKLCFSPSFDPNSLLFKAKQEKKESAPENDKSPFE